jgi:hypothetical protein
MFRMMTVLTIAIGVDLFLFDGKYTYAVWQVLLLIFQHF